MQNFSSIEALEDELELHQRTNGPPLPLLLGLVGLQVCLERRSIGLDHTSESELGLNRRAAAAAGGVSQGSMGAKVAKGSQIVNY